MQEIWNKKAFMETGLPIAVSVTLSLLLCHGASAVGITLQSLAVCTAAVMCTQSGKQASWKAGLNRILGVICGGALGIAAVLIDQWLDFSWGFPVLIGICTAVNLLLCTAVKLPAIQGRVSCMSLLLTTLVLHGTARISYALGRLLGTVVGAAVALLVSMAFAALCRKGENNGH